MAKATTRVLLQKIWKKIPIFVREFKRRLPGHFILTYTSEKDRFTQRTKTTLFPSVSEPIQESSLF